MMAAAVVTAATCAQEEKIQKHITPTETGMLPPTPYLPAFPRPCILYSFYFPLFSFILFVFLFCRALGEGEKAVRNGHTDDCIVLDIHVAGR